MFLKLWLYLWTTKTYSTSTIETSSIGLLIRVTIIFSQSTFSFHTHTQLKCGLGAFDTNLSKVSTYKLSAFLIRLGVHSPTWKMHANVLIRRFVWTWLHSKYFDRLNLVLNFWFVILLLIQLYYLQCQFIVFDCEQIISIEIKLFSNY